MAIALPFYPAHTALLGLDCQTGVVSIYAKPQDTDADLHRVLMERLFPLRGEVTTAAEFVKAVKA
jgi:hypothetical protein